MVSWYWKKVGGTLAWEFPMVRGIAESESRRADAVILPDGPTEIRYWKDIDLRDRDVVVVQAKAKTLNLLLMGQAFFSTDLIKRHHGARTVRGVALCLKDDLALREVLESYPHMQVMVVPAL